MHERTGGIIVTGGASGIGLATARALAETRVPVIVCDIIEPAEQFDGICFLTGDIRNSSTIKTALAKIGEQLNGLVLCAALGPFHDNPEEIIKTNYHAQVENVLACQNAFVEQTSVVMLSSIAGSRFEQVERWSPLIAEPFYGTHDQELWRDIAGMLPKEAYALSKWAVRDATLRLGRMFIKKHVRVNCVVPGPTITKMSEPLWRDSPKEWMTLIHELPSQVANKPEDVAAVIKWLCTDAACGVFGSFLNVDSGWKLIYDKQLI